MEQKDKLHFFGLKQKQFAHFLQLFTYITKKYFIKKICSFLFKKQQHLKQKIKNYKKFICKRNLRKFRFIIFSLLQHFTIYTQNNKQEVKTKKNIVYI